MKLVDRMSRAPALTLLHSCLEEGGVIPGPHFSEALSDEGLTVPDAVTVMKGGNIYDEPQLDAEFREWKYKVEGYEPDGNWLCIVFSFKAADQVSLITIWSVEARRRE